jgi:hypothetical protein
MGLKAPMNLCCMLVYAVLQALCEDLVSLQQLKLSHVAGLSDAGIRGLSYLTGLTELCVLAPANMAVTQGSLEALAPLRDLRWVSLWWAARLTLLYMERGCICIWVAAARACLGSYVQAQRAQGSTACPTHGLGTRARFSTCLGPRGVQLTCR